MKTATITFQYLQTTAEQLSSAERQLLDAAKEACSKAYAPYSKFRVGAALMLDNGIIVAGNNQENAAYPSGTCAERCAIFYANANYPDNAVSAIAIVAMDSSGSVTLSPVSPCGACRQVLLETENRYATPIRILLCGAKEVYVIESARSLLPLQFDVQNISI